MYQVPKWDFRYSGEEKTIFFYTLTKISRLLEIDVYGVVESKMTQKNVDGISKKLQELNSQLKGPR